MHRGLDFKFGTDYYVLSSKKLDSFRKEFEDLQIFIIDEMSMLGSDRLYDVNRRSREIFISNDSFGGKGALFVGDPLQLPPVKARPVYSKPSSYKNWVLWSSSDNLWDNCEVIVLQVNHRQGDGNSWTDTLNR